ncbi:MAG: exodeoxyribonuclease V subunit gamma [Deltaproteobacteria bacterium]|jgi:exodeoxyribonuclease V gamma subunit|nr:exodeoxyribonuclease V subunit gamma [Deltaproteobacteria bacterium]
MPGIHLYSSNRLEILADTFAGLLKANPSPPLQKEIILVQSRGMARWLAMETASRLNIWANCDCPFPNTFIQNIYKLLLPDIPAVSAFNKEYSLWHIMAILPEFKSNPHFYKASAYLESGDDLKLYQLARETADLFDQYTLFRPRMILEWEENINNNLADQSWQSVLWCGLVKRLQQNQQIPEHHRARLLQLFEKKISDPAFDSGILPPRISVFGISSLPPFHLRMLEALAHHIDLHFFLMNPCMEYWFDIIADRNIVKISRSEAVDQESLHLHQGNSLLASMGHLGRDFMAMLQELLVEEHNHFDAPRDDSLLSSIQKNILYLQENNVTAQNPAQSKQQINENDSSVAFHSCHSPMREVEILHDQLLDMFDEASTDEYIEPGDVLVMAPEIETYASLIKSVFDADTGSPPKIPYSISDQSIRSTSRYIETFLDILSLAQSRFSSIEIMSILEAEAVRNRFNINDSELPVIEHWLRETNICWGVDQNHKTRLQLPPYKENTWRDGLDRLLLGYALPGHNQVLFQDILPYDNIEGDNSSLLGNLLDFTENLFNLADLLQQQLTLAEWSEVLLQTQDNLLLADENTAEEERILHSLLLSLKELQDKTFYQNKISLGVIRSYLINTLDERFSPLAAATGFLTGGVTFCSMLPMRAIPFKVVYLLGLNDGLYPRSSRKRSFDLMTLEPKPGDRSRRYDDRYLFLETLLSARKKLFISFVGLSIQDGAKRPPSVLVSELMDYIDRNYTQSCPAHEPSLPLSTRLTTVHHLQPFHPDYFKPQVPDGKKKLFSYSSENCEAAISLQSGQREISQLFTAVLPSPPDEFKHVELQELIRFFSHPARYILTQRVGIAPIEDSQALKTSEPFNLEGLARYKLENSILDHLLRNQDCDRLYQIKKAAGKLPHGMPGKIYFNRLVTELASFQTMLTDILEGQELKKLQIDLAAGDFKLTGFLDNVSIKGLVTYRYAAMTAKDVIRNWISHLVLNNLIDNEAVKERNTYYACKTGFYKYSPTAKSNRYLEDLLDLYWQGLCEPLFFFPNTSHAFAREIHKAKSEQEALHKAAAEWEGNSFNKKGDRKDPYNLLCCKNITLADPRFMETAKVIFLPALEHQEKIKLSDLRA